MHRFNVASSACLLLLVLTAPALLTASDAPQAVDPGWITDLAKARKLSKETGRPILADFTGSDWCGWCKKLDKDVFGTAQFRNWAKNNVVLLKVDFPKHKQLPPDVQRQNFTLQKQFRISGYPTMLFMTEAGGEVGRIKGYCSIDKLLEKGGEIVGKSKASE